MVLPNVIVQELTCIFYNKQKPKDVDITQFHSMVVEKAENNKNSVANLEEDFIHH